MVSQVPGLAEKLPLSGAAFSGDSAAVDESDAPARDDSDVPATATLRAVDPLMNYLKQIREVPPLTAEQEADLAKRVQAGLFAEERLASGGQLPPVVRDDLSRIADDGRRAKSDLVGSP